MTELRRAESMADFADARRRSRDPRARTSDRVVGGISTLALFLAFAFGLPLLATKPRTLTEPQSVMVQLFANRDRSSPKIALGTHLLKVHIPQLRPPTVTIQSDAPFAMSIPPATTNDAAYLARVEEHIQRFSNHLVEPHQMEAVADMDLIIDRSGNLLFLAVAKSSGSAALDNEALSQVRRAQPLPAMPEQVQGDMLYMLMPVCFNFENKTASDPAASPTTCHVK